MKIRNSLKIMDKADEVIAEIKDNANHWEILKKLGINLGSLIFNERLKIHKIIFYNN